MWTYSILWDNSTAQTAFPETFRISNTNNLDWTVAFYDCEREFIVCCGVVALLGYRKRVTLADAVTFGSWISLTTSVSWLSLHRTRRARPKEPSPTTFCTEYLSMWLLYSPHGGHHEQKRLISTRSGSSAPVRIFCFTAYSDDEDLTVDNGYD